MSLVVGFDSAWGGTGWAIATAQGPLSAGHFTPGTWREADLLGFLRGPLEGQLVELQAAEPSTAAPLRIVVERLPWNYQRPGNPTKTVYGHSACAHVIVAWGCRPGWGYPWLIPPSRDRKDGPQGWRDWWGIKGKGRAAKKADAVWQVQARGWGGFLAGLTQIDAEGDGQQGDTAEAILIAVGAAKHTSEAPRGPAAWRTA